MHIGEALRRGFSVAALLALGSWAACSPTGGDEGECASDDECKGDRVCDDGECVDPGGAGAGAASGNGPTSGPGGGESEGECVSAGGECASATCCSDAVCVDAGDAGMRCGAKCTIASDCNSSCCADLGADKVCGPVAFCSGSDPICVFDCIDDPGCYTDPPSPVSGDCVGCAQAAVANLSPCAADAIFGEGCQSSPACQDMVDCVTAGGSQASCANQYPAGYAVVEELVLRYCGCGF